MGAVAPQSINEAQHNAVLVAGEESVGRQLRLRTLSAQEYIGGQLTEFRSETGEHKFTAHDGREEWVSLAHRAFQWMSPMPANARPNPTFMHFPGNHEAIGWKVQVYWNEMGRWYKGRVRAYDQMTGLHQVKYFDGDVRWYTVRDEAILWISEMHGTTATATAAAVKKSTNGITGTAPEGSETDTQRTKTPRSKTKTPRHQKNTPSTVPSTSTSSMESSQSGRLGHEMHDIPRRNQLPGGMTLRPRKPSNLGHHTIDKNPKACILHCRVAIFWPSDDKYYRGTVQGYNEESEKYRVLYDDQQDEEMSLEKEVFRWLGPKGITAGYTTSMHEIMAVRGATNVCRIRSSPTIETARTDLAALSRPKEAVGRRLFIYWEATGEKIEAEVLSYDHRRKLHYVWYRDGELEWVDLKRERFAWIDDKNNNRLVREFPAGLDEGETIPRGKAAVGWRVAVYWSEDVQFYDGRISKYNADTGRHDVDYDDGQMETLSLSSEKITWKSSPHAPKSTCHSIDSSSSSEHQKTTPTRKKTAGHVQGSPKQKRPRLPSPPSTDLAKENNAGPEPATRPQETSLHGETVEDVRASTRACFFQEPSLKRPAAAELQPSSEGEEEELDILPVMQIPPDPLPPLNHTRLAKLPLHCGGSAFQVKLIAAGMDESDREACGLDALLSCVQDYQSTSIKIGRLPSAIEVSASSQLLPPGPVTSAYPTKEMTGMETVTSRVGFPLHRRSPVARGRGRKKGRPTILRKSEMGGTPASLGSVLASFPSVSVPQISPSTVRPSVPPVILPETMVPPLDYSKTLFDHAARCGKLTTPFVDFSSSSSDALCLLKDNIGTTSGSPAFQKRDPSMGGDPV